MELLELLQTPETYITLLTLSLLEIILGVDNIIFISIITGRLPAPLQARARTQGILLAIFTRIILLLSIFWIAHLKDPILFGFSGRDVILFGGGLFLVVKSIKEIFELFHDVQDQMYVEDSVRKKKREATYLSVVIQVIIVDIVFSFDSVITAVGLVQQVPIMITAIVISMLVMLSFAGGISRFVNTNPTMKMLALVFLVLIGVVLILEGVHVHFSKNYLYSAVAFALVVEMLNLRLRRLTKEGQLGALKAEGQEQ